MKPIAIIGAGGIGSFLCAILAPDTTMRITLIDGDRYEERNRDRQWAASLCRLITGQPDPFKASVLASFLPIDPMPEFLETDTVVRGSFDLVISAVDNNKGRHAARELAAGNSCPLVIAANEHNHGIAALWRPEWEDTPLDPFTRHPVWRIPSGRTSEDSCTSAHTLDEQPQTPWANATAACAAAFLLRHAIALQSDDPNAIAEITFVGAAMRATRAHQITNPEPILT